MVKCRYCGTANPAGSTYCSNCGGAFAAAPAGKAAAQVGQAAPAPGAKPVPNAAPSVASATATPPRTQTPTGMLSPQTRLNGRYLVLATVGQGGMAAVYRAMDTKTNRQVAIKEMSQDGLSPDEEAEALAAFQSEADMLQRLRHPNLPRVWERFSDGARHYLVMEFVEGQTLEQRQQGAGGKPLPETEVMRWAAQLCSVLAYLHTQRPPIIFRDLKPANVMVTPQGQVKLIDFGIARVFHPGRTRDTQVLGTPGFAPPEQYGKSQTDARADVYALGVTIYQLLTGYDPAATPFTLPAANTRNPYIAPHIQAALERATKLDRDARYASVAAFEKDLLRPDGFVFRNGQRARTLQEMIALCRAYPQEAQEHLYARRLEGWLNSIGQPQAARVAASTVAAGGDRNAGLGAFLTQVSRPQRPTAAPRGPTAAPRRPTAAPAQGVPVSPGAAAAAAVASKIMRQMAASTARRLMAQAAAKAATAIGTQILIEVRPRSVNFGALMAGQRGTMAIAVGGQGGLPVTGRIVPGAGWLRVDRTTFAGASTIVQLTVDTAKLPQSGSHQTTLQIFSGTQQVHVPVSVDVLSTRTPNAPPPPKKRAARAPSAKHGSSAPTTPEWLRTILSWLSALGMAVWGPHELTLALSSGAIRLPSGFPVALALMTAMVFSAAPGAVVGRWGRDLGSRLVTAAIGAAVGVGAAWLLMQNGPAQVSLGASVVPGAYAPLLLIVLGALGASAGAAIGATPVHSGRMMAALGFVWRHTSAVFVLGALGVGGWLGFTLTRPLFYGLLAPAGMIVGMVFAVLLTTRVNRVFQRVARHP